MKFRKSSVVPRHYKYMEIKCKKCGECCRKLYWFDRLSISLKSKTLMLAKKCKFLGDDNLCKVHDKRAKCCRNWGCGLACGLFENNDITTNN